MRGCLDPHTLFVVLTEEFARQRKAREVNLATMRIPSVPSRLQPKTLSQTFSVVFRFELVTACRGEALGPSSAGCLAFPFLPPLIY